jgi:hypothetical protein
MSVNDTKEDDARRTSDYLIVLGCSDCHLSSVAETLPSARGADGRVLCPGLLEF